MRLTVEQPKTNRASDVQVWCTFWCTGGSLYNPLLHYIAYAILNLLEKLQPESRGKRPTEHMSLALLGRTWPHTLVGQTIYDRTPSVSAVK